MPKSKQAARDAERAERVRVQARERKRRQLAKTGRSVTAQVSGVPTLNRKAPQESRIASRSKRDPFARSLYQGGMPNPDRSLQKFGTHRGITLYTLMLHQYAAVAGHCRTWTDHILTNEITIKSAKAENEADQALADEAAERAKRAWVRVRNRVIALQSLLMGRFYGFARVEKVGRFDEIVGEWIPDLYDVDQEHWRFDDDGREFLVITSRSNGIEVDPARFIHFQWGSADTKYGHGDLSYCYLALWKIQQLETLALQRIEDNESTVIVHYPRTYSDPEVADLEASYADEYRKVIMVPSDKSEVTTEMPTLAITTSGAAGRQEYEGIRFYERWVQTMLLGAPQTGDKSLGTGKLEQTRQEVWEDKTPLGLSALDQCLNEGWMTTYCGWNMAGLPVGLWPRFESDSTGITEGLSGIQASEARNVSLDLNAKRLTPLQAVEHYSSVGISRSRAQAMSDSGVAERDGLNTTITTPSGEPRAISQPTEPDEDGQEEDAA